MSFLLRPLSVWRMGGAFHSFPPSCHIISMQICIAGFASQIASLFLPLSVSALFRGADCSYSNRVFDLGNPPPFPSIQSTHTHTYEHTQCMITFLFICRRQSFAQSTSTPCLAANHAKQVKHEKLNTFPILWPFQNTLGCSTACLSLFFCMYQLSLVHIQTDKNTVQWVLTPPLKKNPYKFIPFPPSLSLPHTHRARLPVQEDVCSAHFNMNIIILYLAAIRFPCHKPTQASSFLFLNTGRQKNHINFPPVKLKCHYV